jgi:hypothetical protein
MSITTSRGLGAVGQAPPGDGEHAQPLRRVPLEGGQHLATVGLL